MIELYAQSGFPKVTFSMSASKRRLACIKSGKSNDRITLENELCLRFIRKLPNPRMKLVPYNRCEPAPSQETRRHAETTFEGLSHAMIELN